MTYKTAPDFRLSPPLDWIRREHLGLSDELIAAVRDGRTSAELSHAARGHPDWAVYAEEITEPSSGPIPDSSSNTELPAAVLDAIKRKAAAAAAAAQFGRLPQPGQIVLVSQIRTPPSQHLNAFLGAPLYVLLDGPYPGNEAIWYGWLATGDTDYAGYWDFLLQETDEPFTPAAAMVQVWNPVQLYLPMAESVVAELRPERLQAVRALAGEFLLGAEDIPPGVIARPGQILVRKTQGALRVVTGTPMRAEHDPRREYQAILVEAAEALREPARLALRQSAVAPEQGLNAIWQRLTQHWRARWSDFTTTPAIAVPMQGLPRPSENVTTASAESYLIWPDRMQLRLIAYNPEAAIVTVELNALGRPLTAELFQDGALIDKITVEPGQWMVLDGPEGSELHVHDGIDTRILPFTSFAADPESDNPAK